MSRGAWLAAWGLPQAAARRRQVVVVGKRLGNGATCDGPAPAATPTSPALAAFVPPLSTHAAANSYCNAPVAIAGFTTYQNLNDNTYNSVRVNNGTNMTAVAAACAADATCKAFDTNGWLKSNLAPSTNWVAFGSAICNPNLAMYVKPAPAATTQKIGIWVGVSSAPWGNVKMDGWVFHNRVPNPAPWTGSAMGADAVGLRVAWSFSCHGRTQDQTTAAALVLADCLLASFPVAPQIPFYNSQQVGLVSRLTREGVAWSLEKRCGVLYRVRHRAMQRVGCAVC